VALIRWLSFNRRATRAKWGDRGVLGGALYSTTQASSMTSCFWRGLRNRSRPVTSGAGDRLEKSPVKTRDAESPRCPAQGSRKVSIHWETVGACLARSKVQESCVSGDLPIQVEVFQPSPSTSHYSAVKRRSELF